MTTPMAALLAERLSPEEMRTTALLVVSLGALPRSLELSTDGQES